MSLVNEARLLLFLGRSIEALYFNPYVMYSFKNDYSEGCHPSILEKLLTTNLEQQYGYGDDMYCHEAKECIKRKIENPNAEIYFVSG